MGTVNATEARASLPELLDRVGEGEEITITRHGRPVAVLVPPSLLRSRRLEDLDARVRRLDELMEKGRHRTLSGPGISPERAEQLVRELRADRDAE